MWEAGASRAASARADHRPWRLSPPPFGPEAVGAFMSAKKTDISRLFELDTIVRLWYFAPEARCLDGCQRQLEPIVVHPDTGFGFVCRSQRLGLINFLLTSPEVLLHSASEEGTD